MPLKSLFKWFIPEAVLRKIQEMRRESARRMNRARSTEEVFTRIYERNVWGGAPGEFCSGSGSANPVTQPYLEAVRSTAEAHGFLGKQFVDLGCGDFRVGSELAKLSGSYVGVDVVRALVESHQSKHGREGVSFARINIIEEELPAGEVCFIRQVLQHLSNDQICQILPKLSRYRWALITEHYPTDNPAIQPNLDKPHGGDIRLYANSGVYLDREPFNLPGGSLQIVHEATGAGSDPNTDPGVIRTYLYQPSVL